jgi:hypothetical protein
MEKELDEIEFLKARKKYHLAKIAQIDKALAAFEEELETQTIITGRTGIAWKKEIMTLFNEVDRGLSGDEVKKMLSQRGIPEALTKKGHNNIFATLSKMKTEHVMEKDENGVFHLKRKENPLFK